MPRKDGFEVLKYMKDTEIKIPVVVTCNVDVSEKLKLIGYPVHIEEEADIVADLF